MLCIKMKSLNPESLHNALVNCGALGCNVMQSRRQLATYKTTWGHNRENHNPHFHCHENLKQHIIIQFVINICILLTTTLAFFIIDK